MNGLWQLQAEILAKHFTNPALHEALSESWSLSFHICEIGLLGASVRQTKPFNFIKMPPRCALSNLSLRESKSLEDTYRDSQKMDLRNQIDIGAPFKIRSSL